MSMSPTRRRLLAVLGDRRWHSLRDLAGASERNISTTFQHLRVLVAAGLVDHPQALAVGWRMHPRVAVAASGRLYRWVEPEATLEGLPVRFPGRGKR